MFKNIDQDLSAKPRQSNSIPVFSYSCQTNRLLNHDQSSCFNMSHIANDASINRIHEYSSLNRRLVLYPVSNRSAQRKAKTAVLTNFSSALLKLRLKYYDQLPLPSTVTESTAQYIISYASEKLPPT